MRTETGYSELDALLDRSVTHLGMRLTVPSTRDLLRLREEASELTDDGYLAWLTGVCTACGPADVDGATLQRVVLIEGIDRSPLARKCLDLIGFGGADGGDGDAATDGPTN